MIVIRQGQVGMMSKLEGNGCQQSEDTQMNVKVFKNQFVGTPHISTALLFHVGNLQHATTDKLRFSSWNCP